MTLNLRPRRRPVPAIPIVSLIDIMVILLIFFIATTTFREKKLEVKINLPQSKGLGGEAAQVDARKAITITEKQDLYVDGNKVDLEKLAEALIALKQANPTAKLELEADTGTELGVLVKVWDALRAAGFSINDVPARIQRLEGK